MKENETINLKPKVIEIKMRGRRKPLKPKSGAWAQWDPFRVDKRKEPGKSIEGLRKGLVSDLGGNPDNHQWLLIKRICSLYLKAVTFDAEFIRSGGHVSQGAFNQYVACENAIRRNLSALGIDKGKKKPTLDLASYLAQREAEKREEKERPS
jgi:hypothetical protein